MLQTTLRRATFYSNISNVFLIRACQDPDRILDSHTNFQVFVNKDRRVPWVGLQGWNFSWISLGFSSWWRIKFVVLRSEIYGLCFLFNFLFDQGFL